MTPSHAIAFVNYRYFRTTDDNRSRYGRAYTYISKKPRILQLVSDGGTLWIATSFPIRRGRRYSLAFKLVGCEPFDVPEHLRRMFGAYGVIGRFSDSRHYPRNDLTDVLLSLDFAPKKPIRNPSVIGMSLMTARQLAAADIVQLEAYEDKLLHGRHIFISYSSQDRRQADLLQDALELRGHRVWRDVRSIACGEEWEPAIYRAIGNADAFLLLVSDRSAQSEWVRDEVRAALSLYERAGRIQRIVPLVQSSAAWDAFPELHRFQRYEWAETSRRVPSKLIEDLKGLER
ncbi:MAG: toll/interleukin-1 receptor domain-containing protein [Anaerolineae bacterium]|nr:toll/interleukin-1 receptor domain-containing protein [Anaerolineae bacterium]